MVFICEGLDKADPADCIFYSGITVSHSFKHRPHGFVHAAVAIHNDKHKKWYDQKGENSQLDINIEHDNKGTDKRNKGNKNVFQPKVRHFDDFKQVIRQIGKQAAGLVVV